MIQRKETLIGILQGLRIAYKEGFDIDSYIQLQERDAETLLDYTAEEAGSYPRKITLTDKLNELSNCVSLFGFLECLVASIEGPNTELLYETCEDIEASTYLVLAGHYRQAVSLLRFACENALLDRYFVLYTGYEQWKIGEFFVPSGMKLIKAVFASGYKINKELNSHIKELSSFVHVNSLEVTNHMDEIHYDSLKFDIWYRLFVRSITLTTKIVIAFYYSGGTLLSPNWGDFERITGITEGALINGIWDEN